MDTRSSNQVNAIRTTTQFCTDNATATSAITAFAGILTTAKNKLVLIDNYDILATSTTKGVTLDTRAIRNVMESIAFKCSRAVIAFASQPPINSTLIASVNYTITKLKQAKKEDIAAICEKIRVATNTNIIGASAYGITATDVTDLVSAISLYNSSSSNPRQAIINKDDAGAQIKTLVKEINQNIFKNQMDNMVLTLQATNSEFVNKYFLAREIIDLGTTHTKIKGSVKDNSNNPIPLASVKLMKTGTTIVDYLIKCSNLGLIPNTLVKPDNYDILVERAGFIPITEINVHFTPGKTITRNFILIPL